MNISYIPVNKIKNNPANPRAITERQKAELRKSLNKFGFVEPIVLNNDLTVIGGHQRLATAIDLGHDKVPAFIVSLNQKDADELTIRLNKNQGHFDFELLESFPKSDLVAWGFESYEFGLNPNENDFDSPGDTKPTETEVDDPIVLKFVFESFDQKENAIAILSKVRNAFGLNLSQALTKLCQLYENSQL